jgi:lysophospholipase L1-like esterase
MSQESPHIETNSSLSLNRSHWIKYLARAVFWIILVLIGFEIILRFFVSGLEPVSNFSPELGPRPVAGSVIKFQKEGNGIIHYSADGEIATPFQGGTNIIVFGDSQTASYQVNDDQNYVSVAETNLHDKGIMVDLHNFGYPAGTLADYSYWASLTQTRYAAGIVVIQISTNDFFGTGGAEGYIKSAVGNYFKKNADGTLTLVHEPIQDRYAFIKPIITKSALLSFTVERLRLFRGLLNLNAQDITAANDMAPASVSDATGDHNVSNYRAQLSALHSAYQGQKVILVVLPSSPAISGDQIVLENSDYSRLLAEAQKFEDWQVVDPLSEFQTLWLEEQKLPRGFSNSEPGTGHLNADGHVIVGRLLADTIEEVMK